MMWLMTGTLNASAIAATFNQGVIPPTCIRSIIKMSTDCASSIWRNDVTPQLFSSAITGIESAAVIRARPA